MTVLLFGITLLVGLIAGFVLGVTVSQWASDEYDAEMFRGAGLERIDGKWVPRKDRPNVGAAAESLHHPELTVPSVHCWWFL